MSIITKCFWTRINWKVDFFVSSVIWWNCVLHCVALQIQNGDDAMTIRRLRKTDFVFSAQIAAEWLAFDLVCLLEHPRSFKNGKSTIHNQFTSEGCVGQGTHTCPPSFYASSPWASCSAWSNYLTQGALLFFCFFSSSVFPLSISTNLSEMMFGCSFCFGFDFFLAGKNSFFMTNGILSSSVELLRNYFPVDLSYSSLLDIISGCEYWIRWLSCSRRVRPCKHDEYCKNNWKFQVCLLFQMVLSEENDCFLRNCFKVRYFSFNHVSLDCWLRMITYAWRLWKSDELFLLPLSLSFFLSVLLLLNIYLNTIFLC